MENTTYAQMKAQAATNSLRVGGINQGGQELQRDAAHPAQTAGLAKVPLRP